MNAAQLLSRPDIAVPRAERAKLGRVRFEGDKIPTEHCAAERLIAYWAARRGRNGLVARDAIRPWEMKNLLPNLFIAEPVDGEWRYRLAGTAITEHVGTEFTNRFLRGVFDLETAIAFSWLYTVVADNRQPISRKGCFFGSSADRATAEIVHLPILGRNGAAVWVLGGAFFSGAEPPSGPIACLGATFGHARLDS